MLGSLWPDPPPLTACPNHLDGMGGYSMFTKLAVIEEKTSKLQGGGGTPRKRTPLSGLSPTEHPLSARSAVGPHGSSVKPSSGRGEGPEVVSMLQRALRDKDSLVAHLQVWS